MIFNIFCLYISFPLITHFNFLGFEVLVFSFLVFLKFFSYLVFLFRFSFLVFEF